MADVKYTDFLYDLQMSDNTPLVVDLLPDEKQIFEVDLNSRTVSVPQFLSVRFDHNAEVVYFKVPRYFEGVDLSTTTCVVQYINAEGDVGIYCIPFYDLTHFDEDETGIPTPMMLMPWSLGGLATVSAGTIKFNLRFYQINPNTKKFAFNLSTQTAEGVILHGMDLSEDMINQFKLDSNITEQIYQSMRQMMNAAATYWIDFADDGTLLVPNDLQNTLVESIPTSEIDSYFDN